MKKSKFLDIVREVIRTNHLSYSTEKSYIDWIYRFILFQNKRHPEEMGGKEFGEFLTYLLPVTLFAIHLPHDLLKMVTISALSRNYSAIKISGPQ